MPTDEDADPCGFRPARCSVYKLTVPKLLTNIMKSDKILLSTQMRCILCRRRTHNSTVKKSAAIDAYL